MCNVRMKCSFVLVDCRRLLPKKMSGASIRPKSIASRGVRIRRWWPPEAWTLQLSSGVSRNPTNISLSRVRILFIVLILLL